MSDFESSLNSILSSPEQMERIMNLARSLSGGEENPPQQAQPSQEPQPNLLSGLDPKLLSVLTRLMSDMNGPPGDKAALVQAMRPFLRQERYASLNQALTIAKLARAAKTIMTEMGGEKLV